MNADSNDDRPNKPLPARIPGNHPLVWLDSAFKPDSHIHFCATFKNIRDAQNAFNWVKENGTHESACLLLARTLIISLPYGDAATDTIENYLQAMAEFHQLAYMEDEPVVLHLTAQITDQETAQPTLQRLDSHMGILLFMECFIPPWQPNDTRSSDQIDAHQAARLTFQTLHYTWVNNTDEELKALGSHAEEIRRASGENSSEYAHARKKYDKRDHELLRKMADKYHQYEAADGELIECWVADKMGPDIPGGPLEGFMPKCFQRMGLAHPSHAPWVVSTDGLLNLSDDAFSLTISFKDPIHAIPAFLAWLAVDGITSFKASCYVEDFGWPDEDSDSDG